jgi:hypothetical protein
VTGVHLEYATCGRSGRALYYPLADAVIYLAPAGKLAISIARSALARRSLA